jgi:hypothetical protein
MASSTARAAGSSASRITNQDSRATPSWARSEASPRRTAGVSPVSGTIMATLGWGTGGGGTGGRPPRPRAARTAGAPTA